jgi:hypothetical protein
VHGRDESVGGGEDVLDAFDELHARSP